jgi:hypothetical protein
VGRRREARDVDLAGLSAAVLEVVARHHDALEEELPCGVELEVVESHAVSLHRVLAADAAAHTLQERLPVAQQDLERDPRADLDRVIGGQDEVPFVQVAREGPDGLAVVTTLRAKDDSVSHAG